METDISALDRLPAQRDKETAGSRAVTDDTGAGGCSAVGRDRQIESGSLTCPNRR